MRHRRAGEVVATVAGERQPGFLGIIFGNRPERQATAADDLRPRVFPDAALKLLHLEQAREALIGGAAHPLAMGLHQSSHEFFDSFEVRRGGVPSPTPKPPHASACRGRGSRAGGGSTATKGGAGGYPSSVNSAGGYRAAGLN